MLFTVVIISVTVGISVTLIIIAKKQSSLGGVQSNLQVALYAADTGLECGLNATFGPLKDKDTPFECTGVVGRPRVFGDTLNRDDEMYYFDFQKANVDALSDEQSIGCGLVIINRAAEWDSAHTGTDGILVESYGYSSCMDNGSGLLVPNTSDPTLTERKLIARIPENPAV